MRSKMPALAWRFVEPPGQRLGRLARERLHVRPSASAPDDRGDAILTPAAPSGIPMEIGR